VLRHQVTESRRIALSCTLDQRDELHQRSLLSL
jgi:hypothetical protein